MRALDAMISAIVDEPERHPPRVLELRRGLPPTAPAAERRSQRSTNSCHAPRTHAPDPAARGGRPDTEHISNLFMRAYEASPAASTTRGPLGDEGPSRSRGRSGGQDRSSRRMSRRGRGSGYATVERTVRNAPNRADLWPEGPDQFREQAAGPESRSRSHATRNAKDSRRERCPPRRDRRLWAEARGIDRAPFPPRLTRRHRAPAAQSQPLFLVLPDLGRSQVHARRSRPNSIRQAATSSAHDSDLRPRTGMRIARSQRVTLGLDFSLRPF